MDEISMFREKFMELIAFELDNLLWLHIVEARVRILVGHPRMFKLFKTISQAAFTSGQRQSLFTGSVSIEKKELAAAATKLKRVSLELGGKNPAIIFNDCELNKGFTRTVESVSQNTR